MEVLINKDLFISYKGEIDAIMVDNDVIVFWHGALPIIIRNLDDKNIVKVTVPPEIKWRNSTETSAELRSEHANFYIFISSENKKVIIT